MAETLTKHEANDAVPGWRALASGLHVTVATDDFATALALVDRIGAIAEEQQHHPDLDLRWGRVHVVTSSHDVGGISDRDVRLATAVNEVLAEMGLEPETTRVAELEIAIDAMDIPAVRPFWAAVLGYDDGRGQTLVDPESVRPSWWFQQMDEPRPQRNRVHVDVWVAPEEAGPRIARAIEAGGRMLSDSEAPSFWVLADPEGNEACICTSAQRG
jgi:4a-hydroxytetrahydrobiopterin dehydratase